ncbi:MAG: molecular chaperone DjiA [Rhodobacteraceae bacterium]|nr:molecular chaperone DjiA [Paracoccaceae bacterium]
MKRLTWKKAVRALQQIAGGRIGRRLVRVLGGRDPRVTFTIAIIALSAKIAKIDGRVTREEIETFRSMLQIPRGEMANVARVYNYASRTALGYEYYARTIARTLGYGQPVLEVVLDALLAVARADGVLSHSEKIALIHIGRIFRLSDEHIHQRLGSTAGQAPPDPYQTLGVTPDDDIQTIRAAWKRKVMQNHPDALVAKGVPPEALRLSQGRLRLYNDAWDAIKRHSGVA